MKIAPLILMAMLMTGCKESIQSSDVKKNNIGDDAYELFVPVVDRTTILENGAIAATYDKGQFPKDKDWKIEVNEYSPSPKCEKLGFGDFTQATDSTGNIYQWGKLAYQREGDYFELNPDCLVYPRERGEEPVGISYVLCSERDNVQVAVCIEMQTDNPNFVEQIFSTFRWKGAEDETIKMLKEMGL